MKQTNSKLLFILFSLFMIPASFAMFARTEIPMGAIWDAISLALVYFIALLFYKITFSNTKKTTKKFYIYKMIWLQEMFIISGMSGTILGVALIFYYMEHPPPGSDPTVSLISNMAIALITILYGIIGAFTIYLIQKFYELKGDSIDNLKFEKPKEGFHFSSLFYYIVVTFIFIGSYFIGAHGISKTSMLEIEIILTTLILILLFILFYKGDSLLNLVKNLFWYVPNTEENIKYNLSYIRNMKKIAGMLTCVALLFVPIIMLGSLAFSSSKLDNADWNYLPYIGIKNGAVLFFWIIQVIFLLSIIEGREVSKLYFETGKISAGDRFYSVKYILAPAFLLFFTFSFGIMISFII